MCGDGIGSSDRTPSPLGSLMTPTRVRMMMVVIMVAKTPWYAMRCCRPSSAALCVATPVVERYLHTTISGSLHNTSHFSPQ